MTIYWVRFKGQEWQKVDHEDYCKFNGQRVETKMTEELV